MSVAGAFRAGGPVPAGSVRGPPLLMASGLTSEHKNPTGRWRTMAEKYAAPVCTTLHRVLGQPPTRSRARQPPWPPWRPTTRRPSRTTSLSRRSCTAPPRAVRWRCSWRWIHPHLVRRMVLSAAACRLGDEGRRLQAEMLRLTEAGDHRGVGALLVGSLAPAPLRFPARGIGWLAGGLFATDDPSDTIAVLKAEDVFDVETELPMRSPRRRWSSAAARTASTRKTCSGAPPPACRTLGRSSSPGGATCTSPARPCPPASRWASSSAEAAPTRIGPRTPRAQTCASAGIRAVGHAAANARRSALLDVRR